MSFLQTDVNLSGKTCLTLGFAGGTLACMSDCSDFDTTGCTHADCGNGRVEGIEECDGANVGGKTCAQLGLGGGTLSCAGDCRFDVSGCTNEPAQCGNNVREGTEKCDGIDLGGQTCESVDPGFTGGTLACKAGSHCGELDTTGCTGTPSACRGPDTYRPPTPPLNVNLADGEPCNFASDCASGMLTAFSDGTNLYYYCGPEAVTPVLHNGDLPLGRACDVAAACQSGYCWMGLDSFICAEPCVVPVTASGPGLACQADPRSPTGASCFPGPGVGPVGTGCVSGAFECADGLCFREQFCTKFCDPTVTTVGDPNGCPASAACDLLGADQERGDVYICVPNNRPRQGEGLSCELPFDCLDGLVCATGRCRAPCPAGSECPVGFFCGNDNPAGPICLPDSTRKGVDEACVDTMECQSTLVCFDEGDGSTCHATCPSGGCAAGIYCVQAEIGPALDTVVTVYKATDAATVRAEDDDSGPGLFSLLRMPLDGGTQTYHIKVSPYPDSPTGTYDLMVSLNAAVPAASVVEIEPNDVWSPTASPAVDQAQALTMPVRVRATFVGHAATADADWFKINTNGTAADTLTVATSRTTLGICSSTPALAVDGEPCSQPATCQNDCFPFIRSGGPSFCAKPCNDTTACGAGVCQIFDDSNPPQGYCFPAGQVGLGNRAFGESCTGPHDCASWRRV